MCYRAIEQQPRVKASEEAGATQVPLLRPRWVVAALALLAVGAFAVLQVRPVVGDAFADQRNAGAQQVVASTVAQPVAIEKVSTTSLPADDGVPTDSASRSAAVGYECHHGL